MQQVPSVWASIFDDAENCSTDCAAPLVSLPLHSHRRIGVSIDFLYDQLCTVQKDILDSLRLATQDADDLVPTFL